jgi:hypothetical protein
LRNWIAAPARWGMATLVNADREAYRITPVGCDQSDRELDQPLLPARST